MASESIGSSAGLGVGHSSGKTIVAILPTKRKKDIWDNFDLCKMSTGYDKARCKKCGKLMGSRSNSTLRQHMNTFCKFVKGVPDVGQTTMSNDGSVWNFDEAPVRDTMAKFVIQESLSFGHFENPRLTRLIQETLQPRYTPVSGSTLKRDCFKMWKKAKEELILGFENLQTGVSLTCDVWSAPHGIPESYLCVTTHWVNPETWQMMRRTIAFELFGYPHKGEDLFLILDEVLTTFKLTNKIFSISFDNASNNAVVVEQLKLKYKPICNGEFFHSQCVAHVINMVVQDGLAIVQPLKESLKEMLRGIFCSSNERYDKYGNFCRESNSPCYGPKWDIPTRWDSTCEMFESALEQKDSLQTFHESLLADQLFDPFSRTNWALIEQVTDILGVFKTATTLLSGVYYPTSSLVLNQLWTMANKLANYKLKGEMFSRMIEPMKTKLKNYFQEIPSVITCAAALNPSVNVTGVEILIDDITNFLGLLDEDISYASKAKAKFRASLENMFVFYSQKYDLSTNIHLMANADDTSGKNEMHNLYNKLRHIQRKRVPPGGELDRYMGMGLLSTMTEQEYENFDILAWWKENECQFPVLSAMARDILTVQASTVALQSAFNVNGRVISLRRTRLSPWTVEMCICLKDHLDAAERIQHISSLEGENHMERYTQDEEEPLTDEED